MRRLLTLILPLALTAACSSSPTSPSAAAGGSGAVVNGAVVSAGSGSSGLNSAGSTVAAVTVPPGLTVSVAGTTLTAAVDAAGAFTLRGVPPGNVQLNFSSPSTSGTVGLSDVRSSETIDIAVSVTGATVTLESQARSMGSETQLEGRIEEFPALSVADDLVVAGRVVMTDANTIFNIGGASGDFADLQIGFRVHVKGQASGLDLLATSVTVQNTNVDIQFPINGIVANLSGTADAFEFEIGRHLIKGDTATEFFGNSEFDDLVDGVRAEVKSQLRDGYFYATRLHVDSPDEDDDEDDQDESSSVEGLLSGLSGAAPDLTFMVGTTIVHTDSSTTVQRKGDTQDLDVLEDGMTVHVVGERQPDGSIVARKVQIKGDAIGGTFHISGSAGGVMGTCPALTFGVNGYDIVTDALTTFEPAVPGCLGLKSGSKVTVEGIVQPNGSVLATTVTKTS
jgi:hypothetical protein